MSDPYGFEPDDDEPELQEGTFHIHPNLQQLFDQHALHGEEQAHSARRFLLDLDKEQLRALRGIVLGTLNDPSNGFAYVGSITTLLDLKENLCMACGKDHDADLQDMAEGNNNE